MLHHERTLALDSFLQGRTKHLEKHPLVRLVEYRQHRYVVISVRTEDSLPSSVFYEVSTESERVVSVGFWVEDCAFSTVKNVS